MKTLTTRWSALVLALLLALSLSVPALAADTAAPGGTAETTEAPDLQTLADTAAAYALEYGGAQSLQYALWQDGEIVLSGQAGTFSRTENLLMTGDELYGIGSVSKIYTTAAVLKLAEQGRVSLDAPVTRYLKDFTMADERYKDITVRMLLNHSSGIKGTGLSDAMLFGEASTKAHDTLLEKLSTQTLAADPGAFSVYCNDGFTLAELVVEAVSGMGFMDYVDRYLLTPAGLEDTFAPGEDLEGHRLAPIYRGTDPPGAARGHPERHRRRRHLRHRLRSGGLRRRPDGGWHPAPVQPGRHGRPGVCPRHLARQRGAGLPGLRPGLGQHGVVSLLPERYPGPGKGRRHPVLPCRPGGPAGV